jgi:hypothetical protein
MQSMVWALIGALTKLRKTTISFVMKVRVEQLGSHYMDFHEIWYLSIFRKTVPKIQVSLIRTRVTGTLHED